METKKATGNVFQRMNFGKQEKNKECENIQHLNDVCCFLSFAKILNAFSFSLKKRPTYLTVWIYPLQDITTFNTLIKSQINWLLGLARTDISLHHCLQVKKLLIFYLYV